MLPTIAGRPVKVLIVDDEPDICLMMRTLLEGEGCDVSAVHTGGEAVEIFKREDFDIVFTDLKLPDINGLEVVSRIASASPRSQTIVMTGYATVETAVEAVKNGACDYLPKPLSINYIRLLCRRAVEKITMMEEITRLRSGLVDAFSMENIAGKSAAITKVLTLVRQTAQSDSPVFITGESGTGKELVARAIHYHSGRRSGRFAAINCGAIASELIESELFGHVRGAFTGADRDKKGFFEISSGGTLFFDEITEMPPARQVKLLRVLQEGEFYRVGSTEVIKMDARIIAASNRSVEELVADGSFRRDLYYRLHVISIHIPPLRERRQDIPILITRYLHKRSPSINTGPNTDDTAAHSKIAHEAEITHEAVNALMEYDFPGNVRELENALEYALTVSRGGILRYEDLPATIREKRPLSFPIASPPPAGHPTDQLSGLPGGGDIQPLNPALLQYERALITAALRRCGGNVSKAARALDIHRQSLQQKLKRLAIDPARL
jgi:DNA-binding NtrC family response regulator